ERRSLSAHGLLQYGRTRAACVVIRISGVTGRNGVCTLAQSGTRNRASRESGTRIPCWRAPAEINRAVCNDNRRSGQLDCRAALNIYGEGDCLVYRGWIWSGADGGCGRESVQRYTQVTEAGQVVRVAGIGCDDRVTCGGE